MGTIPNLAILGAFILYCAVLYLIFMEPPSEL